MTQFSKGDTFVDGQQVTGSRLNQLVDSATLLAGAITDQPAISGAVASVDGILIHDDSTTSLRKTTVGEILGSSIPVVATTLTATTSVTTPELKSPVNGDIKVTPSNGVAVTGKTFASVDGAIVIVNSVAHGLIVGQVISVTASNADYSGNYIIGEIIGVDEFSYIRPVAATPASGTCSYTKLGAERVAGQEVVEQNLYVLGSATINNSLNLKNLDVSLFTNLKGQFKVDGTVAYVLTAIDEQAITFYNNATLPTTWTTAWTSTSLVKPVDEIWLVEADFNFVHLASIFIGLRLRQTSTSTDIAGMFSTEGGSSAYNHHESATFRCVFGSATTFTSTFTLDAISSVAGLFQLGNTSFATAGVFTGITIPSSKFRIYKYKTA